MLKRSFLLSTMVGDLPVQPETATTVFAEPRGGSTWLEELLKTVPNSATIWEPLTISRVKEFRDIGFSWRQHIPEGAEWPEALDLFTKLFHGQLFNAFMSGPNTIRQLREAEHFIIKFCRGSLLLPWLVENFPLKPPVFLVRHPCGVVSSQSNFGAWNHVPASISIQPDERFPDLLERELQNLDHVTTQLERFAALWAINQKYILNHPLNDIAWITISYEEMLLDIESVLRKIFSRWNMEMPPGIVERANAPSKTTRAGSAVHDPQSQLDIWKNRLSPEQVDAVLRIVHRIGVDLLSMGFLEQSFVLW